ncbi:MAG: beta-galactosidase [Gemmatimonadaceae bacterium]
MKRLAVAVLLSLASASAAASQAPGRFPVPDAARAQARRAAAVAAARHTFTFSPTDFLLDGKPYQIRSGEMHPARIPAEYWRHRIQMAKAMGLNTIAAYIFWNYHETSEGRFDFATGNRDIARFIRIAQEEGMWVILRPGPYVCAEWDFGGLPPYLLQDPNLRIRSMYPRYIAAAERYMARLAGVVRPLLVTHGGPILMVQVENEYGSYGNDRRYMQHLRDTWVKLGVDVPFFTADGPTPYMLEAGSVTGAAVGLDSGSEEKHWDLARAIVPGVPVFSSETYPGWLTHWGEPWAAPSVDDLKKEVDFLLTAKKSFNLYVVHGGTNFGFTAGANSGGKGYEPDLTSYDYDAPIDEQGRATPKYAMLRAQIGAALPAGEALPPVPAPVPSVAIPSFEMHAYASLWQNLPKPMAAVHPRPFEQYGQNQGLVLYRTTLVGRKSGKLVITELHDFATVFVDGAFVGTIDRRLGQNSVDLPPSASAHPVLDVLVEGMSHINFAQAMIDRKGITDRVTLSGMTLFNWQVHLIPLDSKWVTSLRADAARGADAAPGADAARPGRFFRGYFTLDKPADTFVDVTGYKKGVVWVNGHNLGRYWDIGPQFRLYCPAAFLEPGRNEVIVFDLLKTDASPLKGEPTLK